MNAFKSMLLVGMAVLTVPPSFAVDGDGHGSVETVTVTGQAFTAAVKGQTPLIETPQNIQVLSADLLAAQDVDRLDEAMRNVAGVMGGGYYEAYDFFRIRGFDASSYIYLDGMRYDSYVRVNAELSDLEQIQIVKGPSSALYGQGGLGGLVNFVSKKPTDEAFLNLSASYGSYDSYALSADGNLPIASDLDARLLVLKRHSGSFVNHSRGNSRIFLAPSATWNIDADTALTLLASYQHNDLNMAMPLTAVGTITPSAYGTYSLKTYTGELGNWNQANNNRTQVGYQFDHRFNSVFSFSQRLRYALTDQRWNNVLYNSSLSSDGRYLSRYPYDYDDHSTVLTTDTSLAADFTTGPVKHTVLIGSDYFDARSHAHSRQIDYSDSDSYLVFDLYDQSYDATATPNYASESASFTRMHDLGFYVQDHLSYDAWTLTGSLRWDGVRASSGTPQTDVAFTPRLGLTYAVTPDNVLFASYSESFLPQSGSTFAGDTLKPEKGQQWETGVKSNLLDGKVNLTASLFYLTRNNVSTSDADHPNYYIQSGKQRSRGFEFDGRFALLDNWQTILTYAYTDAVVISDTTYPKGDELLNVPKNSVGLWTRYDFAGDLDGLSLAGGVYHYSSQAGDLPNTFRLPAYTLVNTQIAYRYGPAELQFAVKNLFNARYYAGSYNDLYVQPGFPRSLNVDLKLAL
jgi:iron complex outermembrane recepter protein